MLIHENLIKWSNIQPNKIAIDINNSKISYSDLYKKSIIFSNILKNKHLIKGDRVAIILPNSIEASIAIFGTLYAKGAFVFINPDFKNKKIIKIIKDCKPKFIIIKSERLNALKNNNNNIFKKNNIINVDNNDWFKNVSTKLKDPVKFINKKNIDIDLASIIYTSGSTGNQKGVALSHRNILTSMISITSYLNNNMSDKVLSSLPFSFDYGLYQLLMSIYKGYTLYLEPTFVYPDLILKKIENEEITGFPIVPTIGNIIVKYGAINKNKYENLKYISSTSDILKKDTIIGLKEIFPNTKIYSMYGLTECKRVSYLEPEKIIDKPESVGKPMKNVEVFIIDKNGKIIDKPGFEGELVVRGSNIMLGYWNKEKETNNIIKRGNYIGDRILYTGDIFKFDEEYDLYFMGRKDNIFKSSGEKVNPLEIEKTIYNIKDVDEVLVTGIEDSIIGKAIIAFVSSKKIKNPNYIKEYCSKYLEKWLVPKKIILLDNMPKNSHGKIDRSILMMELKK